MQRAKWFELGLGVDSQPNQLVVSKIFSNFPSVNLLKSPLMFLHLSRFFLNHLYLHACDFFTDPMYDEAELKWGLIYVVYLQRGSGRMWIVIIKCINSIIMKSCHIFSLAPLCLYELKTLQDSKNRP